MSNLVLEIKAVKKNVKQFNKDLKEGKNVKDQLTQFKHWYYITEFDMFGPSKFIGYENMNSKNYNYGYDKDGRDTEKVLVKWFIKLDEEDKRYTPLWDKLNDMLYEQGKNLRKNAKIHVIK